MVLYVQGCLDRAEVAADSNVVAYWLRGGAEVIELQSAWQQRQAAKAKRPKRQAALPRSPGRPVSSDAERFEWERVVSADVALTALRKIFCARCLVTEATPAAA